MKLFLRTGKFWVNQQKHKDVVERGRGHARKKVLEREMSLSEVHKAERSALETETANEMLQFAYILDWYAKRGMSLQYRSLYRLMFHVTNLYTITDDLTVRKGCEDVLASLAGVVFGKLSHRPVDRMVFGKVATHYGFPTLFD